MSPANPRIRDQLFFRAQLGWGSVNVCGFTAGLLLSLVVGPAPDGLSSLPFCGSLGFGMLAVVASFRFRAPALVTLHVAGARLTWIALAAMLCYGLFVAALLVHMVFWLHWLNAAGIALSNALFAIGVGTDWPIMTDFHIGVRGKGGGLALAPLMAVCAFAVSEGIVSRGYGCSLIVSEWTRTRTISLLLCLCLGIFGAHRFYMRRHASGMLWLLTSGFLGLGVAIDAYLIAIGKLEPLECPELQSDRVPEIPGDTFTANSKGEI